MNPLLIHGAVMTVVVVAAACSNGREGATLHHCPMHPTYTSDRPGDCPICGMDLVPVGGKGGEKGKGREKAGTGSGSGSGTGEAAGWTCPMEECDVHVAEPGKCPKCGMKLVPEAPKAAVPVPGQATVETTPEARRLAGVRTAVATRQRIERTVRTVGTVVADESRIRHVHTKIEGWVDKLHVDFTGQAVRKGMPIMTIYSQELLASQEEYLRAREAAKRFEGSSLPEVRKGGEDLVRAARRRLELFDVPKGFVERLDRTGRPQRGVPVLAPASGVVTAKQVFEGQQVDPGMELFTVTDLSRVWIEADLYENEAGRVRVGDEAVLTLAYDPGVRLAGRVRYVYPYLNPETRTLKVRFDFANPDGALKPAMYANVQLTLEAAEGVVVPDSAVMDTGVRQVAFVAGADGAFEPREVKVGIRAGGRVQVVEGLKDGERVATAANFLLDSESRLRSAIGTHP
ncbi:MAG: efflux RND transporter periplasmic adaptor subunit [Deltaproteobacteria bacterium]|nr:efflux RND transporter periplasmic adaptor subunit [Deltaproteobacteria bacterium]